MRVYSGEKRWREWVPRLLGATVGAVLLFAAAAKMVDPLPFISQLRSYGLVNSSQILIPAAWALITVECTLGTALIVSYRQRTALILTAALLVVFMVAGIYAWTTGVTDDCGCFGSWLKRSPRQGVIEALLLLFATLAGLVFRGRPSRPASRAGLAAVALGCAAGVALPAVFGFLQLPKGQGAAPTAAEESPYFQGLKLSGVDLSHGEHIVILMDTECSHCRQGAGTINDLWRAQQLPEIIVLAVNDKEQRTRFTEEYGGEFPIRRIGEEYFWKMLGDGEIPRTFFVVEGRVRKVWNQQVPGRDAIMEAVEAGSREPE